MKATEWMPYESQEVVQRIWGLLPLPDITAERLHMEIQREDYCSRKYGRTAYQTESRITLPEAYQRTTEKPTHILSKLPTEMAAEKPTKKSTTKLTGKVYQVDQDSLKHWHYWNQPPPEDFHGGRRIRGRR